jgi:hypothetical protein
MLAAKPPAIVILNLFQDNAPPSRVILKQVQDDEKVCCSSNLCDLCASA